MAKRNGLRYEEVSLNIGYDVCFRHILDELIQIRDARVHFWRDLMIRT